MATPRTRSAAPARSGGRTPEPRAADLASLLLIRHFEENLLALFEQGALGGTTHTCLGQEHVAVATARCCATTTSSATTAATATTSPGTTTPRACSRRSRAAVAACAAESAAASTSGASATCPRGAGAERAGGRRVALHYRRTRQRRLAAAFIGDGTWGEGAVYEGLNLAKLWRVPLLVVVENNGIAQSTPLAAHMAGASAAGRRPSASPTGSWSPANRTGSGPNSLRCWTGCATRASRWSWSS
ncbi:thiamine pyrophosphate-dependent enzyme [Streptomyces sp. M19]